MSDELGLRGYNIPAGKYESEKGDVGAILSRYGVPRDELPLLVTLGAKFGCHTYVPDTQRDVSKSCESKPNESKPRQLAFDGFFRQAEYDPTSHLNPDGTRRRRRRR